MCWLPPPAEFAGRWNRSPYCDPCYPEWRREDDRARHRSPDLLARSAKRRRERYRKDATYRAAKVATVKAYRAAHPQRDRRYAAERDRALQAIQRALRKGTLIRHPCAICGEPIPTWATNNGYGIAVTASAAGQTRAYPTNVGDGVTTEANP